MEPTFSKLADAPFLTSLLQQLATRLEFLGGNPWTVEETGAPVDDADDLTSFELRFEGAVQGSVVLRADAHAITATRSAAALEEDGELSELVEHWIEPALAALREANPATEWQATVELAVSSEPVQSFGIAMHANDGTTIRLTIGIDAAAVQSIDAISVHPPLVAFPERGDAKAMNLDLVLDVELNVVLRFGQRQLTLREVLDLTSGSVIELDRQVEEPVELLLEGKVIARGEAVVIDGNYGLRVTEVPQPISQHMLA
ncbi:flagellar motor switch protein FliN/FliY [Bryocella elongata]|uniref:Flagellar motor switch protein FliN n=1 Tax=Bryocella elongata TaxID=863522 RepID=A0A1H5TJP1_9BACT|nr:flagellar motor switch protein FliN [Bryocella elongata]SEF63025.1 flagellar motor switch protein FliN/FliY [Bryocella elongata]